MSPTIVDIFLESAVCCDSLAALDLIGHPVDNGGQFSAAVAR